MITQFQGEYRFLSNFYPAVVILDGVHYPTVEHAYQAAKTLDPGKGHGDNMLGKMLMGIREEPRR